MIRIEVSTADETNQTHRHFIDVRNKLQVQGEKVSLVYVEQFTPMQIRILIALFISGAAFATGIISMIYKLC